MKFIKRVVLLIILIVILYNIMPFALKMWFPYYHKDVVEFYSRQYAIDPLFIAAIIRVESNFNTLAESNKGAKGLMQLMPNTAEWISEQINIQFNEDDLYEPDYNVLLGCWYIANLRKEFNNDINLVLAAYNGGRGNVNKWISTGIWSGKDEDIDNIPFTETRNFIKRVKLTYQMYKSLYNE